MEIVYATYKRLCQKWHSLFIIIGELQFKYLRTKDKIDYRNISYYVKVNI